MGYIILETYCNNLEVYCYNETGVEPNTQKQDWERNGIWTAQDKQKKKNENYFRGLQINFTMTLEKVYIFAGFCILQLREKDRAYIFDNSLYQL